MILFEATPEGVNVKTSTINDDEAKSMTRRRHREPRWRPSVPRRVVAPLSRGPRQRGAGRPRGRTRCGAGNKTSSSDGGDPEHEQAALEAADYKLLSEELVEQIEELEAEVETLRDRETGR
jgi:hypothetical protein